MALTKEQFQALRDKGLSVEQIVSFEKGEKPESTKSGLEKFGEGAMGVAKGVGGFAKELFVDPFITAARAPIEATRGVVGSMVSGASKQAQESKGQLSEITTRLIKKVRELPEGDPRRNALEASISRNMDTLGIVGESLDEVEEKLSPRITGGEAIGAGLTIGGFAIPAGKAAGALQATGIGAARGAMFGAGSAIESKEIQDFKQLATALKDSSIEAIPTALVGGFLGLGFHAGSKIFHKLTKAAPERLYQSALRQTTDDLKKELAGRAPNLSKQLLDKGVKGSENKMLSQSLSAVNALEKRLTSLVKGKTGSQLIETQTVVSSLDDLSRRLVNVYGPTASAPVEAYKKSLLAKGAKIPIRDAVQFTRDIYQELSKSAFKTDASLSLTNEMLRSVATATRQAVGKSSPAIDKIIKDEQMWLRTAQAVEGSLVRAGRANVFGLTDAIVAGTGVTNPAQVLAGVGRRLFETGAVKTNIAVGLNKFGQMIDKLPSDKISPALKILIQKEVSDLIQSSNQSTP